MAKKEQWSAAKEKVFNDSVSKFKNSQLTGNIKALFLHDVSQIKEPLSAALAESLFSLSEIIQDEAIVRLLSSFLLKANLKESLKLFQGSNPQVLFALVQ